MLTTRSAAVALLLLSPALVWPQTTAVPDKESSPGHDQQIQQSGSTGASASPSDLGTQSKPETAEYGPALIEAPTAQKTDDDSELKQTKRIFGFVPNYTAVSPNARVPRLSVRDKFTLAMHDSVDYSSFVLVGLLAGQSMALNSYPELGRGPAGYSRYYWRAFADQVSGTFFTEAIVPAITHEDPRYYTLGHGGFLHRTAYALSRVVVTTTDSGGTSFNFSEIAGDGLEAGVSNLYYPARERGMRKTAGNWATQIVVTAAANVLKEFWPDIRHHLLRQQ